MRCGRGSRWHPRLLPGQRYLLVFGRVHMRWGLRQGLRYAILEKRTRGLGRWVHYRLQKLFFFTFWRCPLLPCDLQSDQGLQLPLDVAPEPGFVLAQRLQRSSLAATIPGGPLHSFSLFLYHPARNHVTL